MQHKLLMSEMSLLQYEKEALEERAKLLGARIALLKDATKGAKGKVESTDDDDDDTDSDEDDEDDKPAPKAKKGKVAAKGKKKPADDDDEDLEESDDPSDDDADEDDESESEDDDDADADDEDDLDEALGKGPGKKTSITDDDIRKLITKTLKAKGTAGKKKVNEIMAKFTKNGSKQIKDIKPGKHEAIHAALKKV